MKRGFERSQRVADMIQKTVALMLIEDMLDDRFHLVTVTGVTVSKDLSYAKIYVSILQDDKEKIKQVVDALNRSAKAFRFKLAKAVKLRIAPELRFAYDESTAHGFHISSLIDAAVKKSEKK